MVTNDEFNEAFDDACESYGNIRILLNLTNVKVTPNVCKMVATFSTQDWIDKSHFEAIAFHEVAHPAYMPEWYEDHLKYFTLLMAIFNNGNTKKDFDDLSFIANVIYDLFVDRYNQLTFKVNLQLAIEHIIKRKSYSDLDNLGTIYQFIFCFYYHCFDKKLSFVFDYEFDEVVDTAAGNCLLILDNRKISKFDKFKKIAHIINNLVYDKHDSLSEVISEAKGTGLEIVDDLMPEMKRKSQEPLSDALESNEINDDVFEYFFEKEDSDHNNKEDFSNDGSEDSSEYNGYSDGEGSGCPKHVLDWLNEAKSRLNFILRNTSKRVTKSFGKNKIGLLVSGGIWNESDDIESLDMIRTISDYGIFIPGEYATRKSYMSQNILEEEGRYNLHIIMDTSGSVDSKDACVSMFSLIEYAKKSGNNVSVALFNHKMYYSDCINNKFTKSKIKSASKYRGFEYKIAKNFRSGTTRLSTAFDYLKTIDKKAFIGNKKDNLIILITDFLDVPKELTSIIEDIKYFSFKSEMIIVSIGDHISCFKDVMPEEIKIFISNDYKNCSIDVLKNLEL